MRTLSLLLSVACLFACGEPDGASARCDPQLRPCEILHDFGKSKIGPGVEVDDRCNSWTLNNETDLWVSSVVLENDGAYHHSNWFFVSDLSYQHADGAWDCDEVGFREVHAAVLGGVLFAQSTQSMRDEQR